MTGTVSEDNIVSIAKPFIKKAFHTEKGQTFRFKVDLQYRYNDSFSRDELKKKLVMKVGRPHRVDLKQPDKTIIVQVFNKACGVSVVDAHQMAKYRAYNIRMVSDEVTGFKKEKPVHNPPKAKVKESEETSKIFEENTEIEFKKVEDKNVESSDSDSEGISLF